MAKWNRSDKPWERQQGESVQAFEAFDLYCRMGPDRSLHKVGTELSKSYTLISRWSSRWGWIERSRAYDNELKRQEIEEQRKATRKMQQRHIQTAMLMQKKAVDALNGLKPEELPTKDILRFITDGARLERETRMEGIAASAREAGGADGQSSLADTIVAAYKKRMEEGGNDDQR